MGRVRDAGQVTRLTKDHDVLIVFLDRSDSDYWRRDAVLNEEFVRGFETPPSLELDLRVTPTDRFRVWRVAGAAKAP